MVNEIIKHLNSIGEVNLSAQKIELGLMSDMAKEIANHKKVRKALDDDMDKFVNLFYDALNVGKKINGAEFIKSVSLAKSLIKETETAVNDLGISPTAIDGYSELKALINTSNDITDNLKDINSQISKMTL